MNFSMRDDGSLNLQITPLDADGNPTTIFLDTTGNPIPIAFDEPPQWSVDDATVLALVPAADGMTCVVNQKGKLGTATVSVFAKITDASAEHDFRGSASVQVTAGPMASLGLSLKS